MAGEPARPELSLTQDAPEEGDRAPKPGIALCLSGGGFRAMLFHLGALWRLNEAGYISKFDWVSSVSGGSIIAAQLGLAWKRLGFGADGVAARFKEELVVAIRALASHTSDIPSVVEGMTYPIHPLQIVAMGMLASDSLQFEELALACEEEGRFEFMVVGLPLRLPGGTGSPWNPIAIF